MLRSTTNVKIRMENNSTSIKYFSCSCVFNFMSCFLFVWKDSIPSLKTYFQQNNYCLFWVRTIVVTTDLRLFMQLIVYPYYCSVFAQPRSKSEKYVNKTTDFPLWTCLENVHQIFLILFCNIYGIRRY